MQGAAAAIAKAQGWGQGPQPSDALKKDASDDADEGDDEDDGKDKNLGDAVAGAVQM